MTQPLTLKRWRPLERATDRRNETTTATFDAEPPSGTLLVDIDHRMANRRNLVTLYRAAEVNGLLDSLFEPDRRFAGHAWYDRLPRITAIDTEAMLDGEKMEFTWTGETSWDDELKEIFATLGGRESGEVGWYEISENAVAEYIVARILVRTEYETQARRLRTDFGVGTESTTWVHDAGILVTPDCTLDTERLKNLIAEAVFEYSADEKEDSATTQWRNFVEEAHTAAARLLFDERKATAESIREAARNHLVHLLPDGRTIKLRKQPGPGGDRCDVDVIVLPNGADRTTSPEPLADEAALVDGLTANTNELAPAINRIARRLLEHTSGIEQPATVGLHGPLPAERLAAMEKIELDHRNSGRDQLEGVALSARMAGAIAAQLADYAETLEHLKRSGK